MTARPGPPGPPSTCSEETIPSGNGSRNAAPAAPAELQLLVPPRHRGALSAGSAGMEDDLAGAAGAALAAMMLLCGSLPPCLAVHGSKPPPFKERRRTRVADARECLGRAFDHGDAQRVRGGAFGNVQSFADGPEGNATGILWFYASDLDQSLKEGRGREPTRRVHAEQRGERCVQRQGHRPGGPPARAQPSGLGRPRGGGQRPDEQAAAGREPRRDKTRRTVAGARHARLAARRATGAGAGYLRPRPLAMRRSRSVHALQIRLAASRPRRPPPSPAQPPRRRASPPGAPPSPPRRLSQHPRCGRTPRRAEACSRACR